MKTLFVTVTITLLLTAGSSWAQTNSFQVDINGAITRDADKFSVKTANLLSSPGNIAVLTTMATNNPAGFFMISIDEIDPTVAAGGTNVVRRLFSNNWDGVEAGKGKFVSTMWCNGGYVTCTNVPAFNGCLMIAGTTKVKNDQLQGLSGTVNGYWKHPLWFPTNGPAALIKGTLKTKAAVAIPVPVPTSLVD